MGCMLLRFGCCSRWVAFTSLRVVSWAVWDTAVPPTTISIQKESVFTNSFQSKSNFTLELGQLSFQNVSGIGIHHFWKSIICFERLVWTLLEVSVWALFKSGFVLLHFCTGLVSNLVSYLCELRVCRILVLVLFAECDFFNAKRLLSRG